MPGGGPGHGPRSKRMPAWADRGPDEAFALTGPSRIFSGGLDTRRRGVASRWVLVHFECHPARDRKRGRGAATGRAPGFDCVDLCTNGAGVAGGCSGPPGRAIVRTESSHAAGFPRATEAYRAHHPRRLARRLGMRGGTVYATSARGRPAPLRSFNRKIDAGGRRGLGRGDTGAERACRARRSAARGDRHKCVSWVAERAFLTVFFARREALPARLQKGLSCGRKG